MDSPDIDPTRTGELRTRPRHAETRVGRPYPKKTHARTDAKHLRHTKITSYTALVWKFVIYV